MLEDIKPIVEKQDNASSTLKDREYYTVTVKDPYCEFTVNPIFCGVVSKDVTDAFDPDGTIWSISGYAPMGLDKYSTLKDAAQAAVIDRIRGAMRCKNCGSMSHTGIEYPYDHPDHYDGVSEWVCNTCGRRHNRFTGAVLTDGTPRHQLKAPE